MPECTYFRTLREAKALIEMWRKEYNTFRPHRALKLLIPHEFAQQWAIAQRWALAIPA